MYKIGIIGHSPEYFSVPSVDEVRKIIRDNLNTLSYQYGKDVIFNVVGEIGAGLWVAEECVVGRADGGHPLNYHLYLPFPSDITSNDWYDYQKELLKKCCNNARSLTICNSKKMTENESPFEALVNDSNFIICYWTGKKQGRTFETIKYALKNNKMMLNGLNGLSLVTNKNIEK